MLSATHSSRPLQARGVAACSENCGKVEDFHFTDLFAPDVDEFQNLLVYASFTGTSLVNFL